MKTFKISSIGEGLGDCFFIELQNDCWKTIIMVDGRKGDRDSFDDIKQKIIMYANIDYLIVTHIDYDHIQGVNKLFKLPATDIIRKAFEHTVIIYNYVTRAVINYGHAEMLEEFIRNNTVIPTCWKNYIPYSSPCLKLLSYEKRVKFDPKEQEDYANCAYLTLIHPNKKEIKLVYQDYREKQKKGEKQPDAELVNQYSIAFLLEYGGKRVLFTGDCYMKELISKINQLKNMANEDSDYEKIHLIKMAHHGAKDNNLGLAEFAVNHKCSKFLVTGEKTWRGLHPEKTLLEELKDKFDKELTVYTNVDVVGYDDYLNTNDVLDMFGGDFES